KQMHEARSQYRLQAEVRKASTHRTPFRPSGQNLEAVLRTLGFQTVSVMGGCRGRSNDSVVSSENGTEQRTVRRSANGQSGTAARQSRVRSADGSAAQFDAGA